MSLKQILTLMLIIALSFITCSDNDNPIIPQDFTSETIVVAFDQTVTIPNTSYTVRFGVVRFEGRIPLLLQQYEPPEYGYDNGWAEIEIEISGISGPIRLPIDAVPPDSVGQVEPGKSVRAGGLNFRLLDLSPFPTAVPANIADSEYIATIAVELDSTETPDEGTFFPTTTGNNWNYSDTLWKSDSLLRTRIYDITVGDYFYDVIGKWHQLNFGNDFLYSQDWSIMVTADTVFMRQNGYFRSYGSIPAYAMPFYINSGPGIDTCVSIMEGDIYNERYVRLIEDTSIVVPAGEFTTVYEYSGHWSYYNDFRVYLAPGVGIIYVEASGMMFDYKAVLNNYSIPVD